MIVPLKHLRRKGDSISIVNYGWCRSDGYFRNDRRGAWALFAINSYSSYLALERGGASLHNFDGVFGHMVSYYGIDERFVLRGQLGIIGV